MGQVQPFTRIIMFSFRHRRDSSPRLNLYRINIHVGRGNNTEMPADRAGAYVSVFVGAQNHEAAARLAVSHLARQGFEFIDIADGKIHLIDPTSWDTFIQASWPDFVDHFPNQGNVIQRLDSEFLCTGPFANYDVSGAGDVH